MTDKSRTQLLKAVLRFRLAIEATDFDGQGFNLKRFPNDCCNTASALLRLYLYDEGFGFFDKAEGRRPDGKEHVWLIQGEVIVDITADQFGDSQDGVIVTTMSPWHETWQRRSSIPTDDDMIERNRDFWDRRHSVYSLIRESLPG